MKKEKVGTPDANGDGKIPVANGAVMLAGNGHDFIHEDELCARLQISRGTAVNYRRDGKLPYAKLGRLILYHWPTVEQALLRQSVGGVQ